MKTKMILLSVLTGLLALATILPAKADTGSPIINIGDLLATSGPVTVPASGSTNVAGGKVIEVTRGQSLAIFPSFNLVNSGASVSNVTFNFAMGPGTMITSSAYGTTNVLGTTNVSTINTNYTVTYTLFGSTNRMGFYYIPAGNIDVGNFTIGSISTTATNATGVIVSNIYYRKTTLKP